jgi:sugar phosphate isomerase/epimerase
MSLDQIVSLATRLQCPHVELRTLNGTVDLPAVLATEFPEKKGAAEFLRSRGVEVVGLNSGFKLTEGDERQRQELTAFAGWADALQARYIRVFGGGKWGEPVEEEKWQRVQENLTWWHEEKQKNGWQAEIILETHDAFSGTEPILQLLERSPHPLPLIWDSHHTWKLAGETPAETWGQLGPHIRHVHLKDSISKPSARHPFTYVHMGDGEFPWRETVDILREASFDGVVSIEWEKLWHAYLEPLETALERCRKLGLW